MLNEEKANNPSLTPSSAPKKCCRSSFFIFSALLLIVCIGFGYWFYTNKTNANPTTTPTTGKNQQNRAITVVATSVKQGDVPIYLKGLGAITPLATVNVKSRVDGQLMTIFYTEGQMVTKGQVLAELDARSYKISLAQAQGQQMKDQALLDNALIDLTRYRDLLKQDSISQQIVDTQTALVDQYKGALKIDTASIDNAKLLIDYCTVQAPISGRIGLRPVDPGNMIHASDATGIAVITQVEPITALFSIPEDNVPQVIQKLRAQQKLSVEAYDRADKIKLDSGFLVSAENQIDATTGTLKLKAQFDNKKQTLFPNQFVNIHLLLDTKHDALLIPSSAVQYGIPGTFVYQVKEDNSVTVKVIKIGATMGLDVLVESGLELGDKIVVDGVDKLREGAKVTLASKEGDIGNKKPNAASKSLKSDSAQ